MDEVELHPWHERTSTHDAWDLLDRSRGAAAHDLRAWLDQPAGAARLRAALEPELLAGADLSDSALLGSALDLLDAGRLVLESAAPSFPVDPHHPVGDGIEELGDLLDLMGDESAANDDGEPSPAQPPRPTWIEIAVVDGLGQPISGRPYRLHLPDGTVRCGVLPADGVIRFDDVDPGLCTLELPTADPAEWAPPQAVAA